MVVRRLQSDRKKAADEGNISCVDVVVDVDTDADERRSQLESGEKKIGDFSRFSGRKSGRRLKQVDRDRC